MKAHELLSDETKWTKGVLAKDAKGEPISWGDDNATCFCAIGAIARVTDCGPQYDAAFDKLESVILTAGFGSVGQWNDAPERTFNEVRSLFIKLDI